jgi:peptide chain release factor 2
VHRLAYQPLRCQRLAAHQLAAVDALPSSLRRLRNEGTEPTLSFSKLLRGRAERQQLTGRPYRTPTGIVVECVNERSQVQNKKWAWILQSKIDRMEQENDKEMAAYGDKGEIAWGNQIRSYVLQPYQLVKDHRTGHQTGNVEAVLDGDLDGFIESCLRERAKSRMKE